MLFQALAANTLCPCLSMQGRAYHTAKMTTSLCRSAVYLMQLGMSEAGSSICESTQHAEQGIQIQMCQDPRYKITQIHQHHVGELGDMAKQDVKAAGRKSQAMLSKEHLLKILRFTGILGC